MKKYMHVSRRVLLNHWLHLHATFLERPFRSPPSGRNDGSGSGGGGGGGGATYDVVGDDGRAKTSHLPQDGQQRPTHDALLSFTQWPPPSRVLDLLQGVENLQKLLRRGCGDSGGGDGGPQTEPTSNRRDEVVVGNDASASPPLPPLVPAAVAHILRLRLEPSVRWCVFSVCMRFCAHVCVRFCVWPCVLYVRP